MNLLPHTVRATSGNHRHQGHPLVGCISFDRHQARVRQRFAETEILDQRHAHELAGGIVVGGLYVELGGLGVVKQERDRGHRTDKEVGEQPLSPTSRWSQALELTRQRIEFGLAVVLLRPIQHMVSSFLRPSFAVRPKKKFCAEHRWFSQLAVGSALE